MTYSPDDIAFERSGAGPPMILVHGCPATHTLWRPLVGELSKHRTLYAIDLPGFGASPAPRDRAALTSTSLASTLLAFATRQGLERFDLVGHSFGSAIAATASLEAPERVASLVMIAPMGSKAPPAARLARAWPVRALVAPTWRVVPHAVRRVLLRVLTKAGYGPAHVDVRGREVACELERGDALHSICRLFAAFDYSEYRRRLERLGRERGVPVLLVGAARDRIVPFSHFDTLRSLLARAEQEVYADGVHALMWQHPEELAAQLVDFIERAAAVSNEHAGVR